MEKIDYELSGSRPVDSKEYDLRGLGNEDNNQRFVRRDESLVNKLNNQCSLNGN